jgi:hypothetical protein
LSRRVCCGMLGLLCPGEARESALPRVAERFPVRAVTPVPPRVGCFDGLGQRAER